MSSSYSCALQLCSRYADDTANARSVGVVLAVGSGVLIGSSFVFKKKGLLSSQKGQVAGEGVAYLKSVRLSLHPDLRSRRSARGQCIVQPMWWTGMIIMILGELCNFGAYAFVEAIVVVSVSGSTMNCFLPYTHLAPC